MRLHEDREMELWEHLSELRSRIFRVLIYLVVATAICWVFYDRLSLFIMKPLQGVVDKYHIKLVFEHITGPFMLKLQVSIIAGVILALPLLTLELWGFIAPGLTREERKGFYFVVPLSLFFFFLGVATAYSILPSAFGYFASFLVPGTIVYQDPVKYWTFVM
jgi:sec-independent protein translocase protein TatC